MKTSFAILSALILFGSGISAYTAEPGSPNLNPPGEAYTVKERGAHHRLWERVEYETTPEGATLPHVHQHVEMATGLHYLENGEWVESKEAIEILPDGGARAIHGQHNAYFPSDLYDGLIELVTPDGVHLMSRPLGLSYFDGTNSVLIAELTNSIGQLLPSSNEVVYPSTFDGADASIRYTYTRAGFEQDIILNAQLPGPEEFGLDPATTRLQVLTEFFSTPAPRIAERSLPPQAGLTLSDQTLDFGAMRVGRGMAFAMNAEESGAAVSKQWTVLDGRQFLVEEVPVESLAEPLRQLPPLADSHHSKIRSRAIAGKLTLPAKRLAKAGTQPIRMARIAVQAGVVLDYTTVNTSQTNFIFKGDMTYYISGNVTLYGANTTFEGGTVLKYNSGVGLTVNTPVTWLGRSYGPVVMTAKDDNRVGEAISGSSGSPAGYYATRALYLDAATSGTNYSLHNLRVANAQTAVAINGNSGHVLGDLQFLTCRNGLALTNAEVKLQNALFYRVLTNFIGSSSTGRVEHLTSDTAIWLNKDIGTNLFLTNSILVAVTNVGNYAIGNWQDISTENIASGVFQTIGAGDHYLVDGSTNRNAGTTNVAILAALRNKTTYPPIVYSNTTLSAITTTFTPQAQRDIDIPDRGYEYDPLDYVFGGVAANYNLTFTAGTAIGWFELPGSGGPGYGIALNNDISASFNGTLTSYCTIARYSTVQEGLNGNWKDKGWLAGLIAGGSYDPAHPSTVKSRFTRSLVLAGDPCHTRDYNTVLVSQGTHCEFFGGLVAGYNTLSYYTNCLFERVYMWQGTSQNFPKWILRDCTHHGGNLGFEHYESGAPYWSSSIRDCAFDGTTISTVNLPGYVDYDYNSFLLSSNRTSPVGAHDVIVTNSYNWQTSWLGNYYLPTNSTLINTGSVANAGLAGLYHFTTLTNQVKETNTVVDIGYHYVAVDNNGIPFDSDDSGNDGIPDYLEDANGNGSVDSGETDWQIVTDPGLKVWITRPRNGNTLP